MENHVFQMQTAYSISLFKEITCSTSIGYGVKQCVYNRLADDMDSGQIMVKRKPVYYIQSTADSVIKCKALSDLKKWLLKRSVRN